MKKLFCLAFASLFFACCTTTVVKQEVVTVVKESPVRQSKPNHSENGGPVDLEGIKRALGLQRPVETLGYSEKVFENCGGKFGLPRSTTCQNLFFVLINFKIQCRDSEGTVTEVITEDELTPYSNRKVKWSLKSLAGEVNTDGKGYGQIQTLSPISQREQRLKLVGKNDFLYLAAGEIKRVVTPRPWCQ